MLTESQGRNQDWIAAHIPHDGNMCLLDSVIQWTASTVKCRCISHRSLNNPLRSHGQLPAVCGIEIAAQAIAVHGALQSPTAGRQHGYLAAVRQVRLNVMRLDDIDDDLIATAERLSGDATTLLYDFDLSDSDRVLLSGRATIILDAGAGATLSRLAP